MKILSGLETFRAFFILEKKKLFKINYFRENLSFSVPKCYSIKFKLVL